MSIIAVKILPEGFEIASDSILVRGYTQTDCNTTHAKLFIENNIIFGGVGYAEETSLLRVFANTHILKNLTELTILDYLAEFEEWRYKKTNKNNMENNYFIGGPEGKVFYVNNWHIAQVATFEAIGAGMDYALAALYLGHSVIGAIDVAIKLSVYCTGPTIYYRCINGKIGTNEN